MSNFTITQNMLVRGCEAFQAREPRDAMYKVATFLINHFWDKDDSEIANGLGVLLLTWNNAAYRYGGFDFDKLEQYIASNKKVLNTYRNKSITDFESSDDQTITCLFERCLDALQVPYGKTSSKKSPVGGAKALHLIAPYFFPLWDYKIAKAYRINYYNNPAKKYLQFFHISRQQILELECPDELRNSGKTMLKLIDEYNYSKYTKGWIK